MDLGLLGGGSVHDFQSLSLSFLITLNYLWLQILMQYFETIGSVHTYSNKNSKHLKATGFFKYW